MEEETEDTLPELPEDLEIILPPEILDKLEEDSFNPDSFTAPPFVPKGKRIFNRPQSSYSRKISNSDGGPDIRGHITKSIGLKAARLISMASLAVCLNSFPGIALGSVPENRR